MSVFENTMLDLTFSIPEIQESIFRHGKLSSRDLANAVRVNRAWFEIVSPFLWENVAIFDSSSENNDCEDHLQSGVVSHGHWIRTLRTNTAEILNTIVSQKSPPCCTRLLVLNISDLKDEVDDWELLERWLSKNSELRVFRWHSEFYTTNLFSYALVPGLTENQNSKSLTTLDLGKLVIDSSLSEILNHYSNTLAYLSLDECNLHPDAFQDVQQPLQHLQSLVLRNNERPYKTPNQDFFLIFMEHFVTRNLIEFTCSTFYPEWSKSLAVTLRFPSLQNLALLDITCLWSGSLNVEQSIRFLEAVPTSVTHLSIRGLRLDEMGNYALSQLVQKNRLVSINATNCGTISEENWHMILTSCRFLKKIVMGEEVQLNSDIVWRAEEPWVCLGLEKFKGSVHVGHQNLVNDSGEQQQQQPQESTPMNTVEFDELVLRKCQKVFRQFGRLTELKKLDLYLCAPKFHLYELCKSENGVSRERNVAGEFCLIWSLLKGCQDLKTLRIKFFLPKSMANEMDLRTRCQEMWGEQAEIRVMVNRY